MSRTSVSETGNISNISNKKQCDNEQDYFAGKKLCKHEIALIKYLKRAPQVSFTKQ